MSYKIPIFLSYPQPFTKKQEQVISKIKDLLDDKGFIGRTLGVTDYDMQEPLTAIRRLMLECNGIITIALRRHYIKNGSSKPNSDLGINGFDLSSNWFTSPYCQVEPAMAFQIGLPIMIIKEQGVIPEGVLEKGVTGIYLPEIDIENAIDAYFSTSEWKQIFGKWEGYVRQVVDNKGKPPKLY
ncbi:MAG TPA: hypothetical protein PLZ45_17145 [Ferruginibacter sp.]|nr:hypothetical protein [Ferruginibacter sp.]